MKKEIEMTIEELVNTSPKDFMEIVINNDVIILLSGNRLCKAIHDCPEIVKCKLKSFNYTTGFVRASKYPFKKLFKNKDRVIYLTTNAHFQTVCYLVP